MSADTALTRPAATEMPLSEVVANRRWVRRSAPFPHVVANDVFTDGFYAQLDAEFRRIQAEHPETFKRNMPGYDASGALLDHHRTGPLGVFVSRQWHDLLNAVAGVTGTGDMSASLHHHDPGGHSGWPHNDLNPGWFADPPADEGEVRLVNDGQVQYHHGTRPEGVPARETVRAVSALFYLANPEWSANDGGQTGLYQHVGDTRPTVAVPPVNNSLMLFHCTPHSWHGFVANVKPRNCVVMWTHRSKDDVVARWGANSIAYW